MAKKTKTKAYERATEVEAAHEAARIDTFLPEIRSDLKWRPTAGVRKPFVVPGQVSPVLAVWSFGVPFAEMDTLHQWLRLNEESLAGGLRGVMDKKPAKGDKVYYAGTYLNIDAGKPMYQTWWAYSSEKALETESAWIKPKLPPRVRDLVVQLRAFWVRDPGRSESRFGLASNYADLKSMDENPFMLGVTIEAAEAAGGGKRPR